MLVQLLLINLVLLLLRKVTRNWKILFDVICSVILLETRVKKIGLCC
jgi:hypothetical protein